MRPPDSTAADDLLRQQTGRDAMVIPHALARLWIPAFALAALVMLPRLAAPQFGLLDDGLMLRTGRQITGNWSTVFHLIPETGRFFPAYWLAHAAVFAFAGSRPLAFFAVNTLILTTVLVMLGRMILLGGGSWPHVWAALVLFALSGPAVEAFYTASKAEPLQLAFIGISLLAMVAFSKRTRWSPRAGLAAVSVGALLLSHATKETSLVMVPIALGWLLFEGTGRSRGMALAARTYAIVNVIAALAFVGLRWTYAPLSFGEGWYTRAYSFDPATTAPAVFRIAAWLLRNFAFLVPLVAVGGWSVIRSRARSPRLVLYAGVWMVGWVAVYVPWPATFEYYFLPFAFGAAALGGAVLGDCWRRLGVAGSTLGRYREWAALSATALLWALTVVNAVADARVQLTVDRANADLVAFLAGVPDYSRVVLNIARANEYVAELPMHLTELRGRPDVSVTYGVGAVSEPAAAVPLFLLTPQTRGGPVPTVRIAPHEPVAVIVDPSGVLPGGGVLVYETVQLAPVVEVGVHRLICRLGIPPPLADASYCPKDRGILNRHTFSYGWWVHRLGSPGSRMDDARRPITTD